MIKTPVALQLPFESQPLPTSPLVLPWACVVADNHRFFPIRGQLRLTAAYRLAKTQIAQRARLYWRQPCLESDVLLVARFWFPDRRKRDAGNYRKALTDALTGIVYVDDGQIADERYIRVGVDRENPRVEVTLSVSLSPMEGAA